MLKPTHARRESRPDTQRTIHERAPLEAESEEAPTRLFMGSQLRPDFTDTSTDAAPALDSGSFDVVNAAEPGPASQHTHGPGPMSLRDLLDSASPANHRHHGPPSALPAPRAPEARRSVTTTRTRNKRSRWFSASLGAALVASFLGVAALLRFSGPTAGSLVVVTTPPDAQVSLDEQLLLGLESPYQATDLALGTHRLLVSKPGFASARQSVTLTQRGELQTLSITLKPEVSTTLAAASDAPVAAVSGSREDAVSAGAHHAHTGILRLTSQPPAAVYIDGKYAGSSPLRHVVLRSGRHKVALENAVTDQRHEFTIQIIAGTTTQRDVALPL